MYEYLKNIFIVDYVIVLRFNPILTCVGLVWLVLTIFNQGAYLTLKSIFHKALNIF